MSSSTAAAATPRPLPRVHQLPAHVANVIAAGEVVERPASVVKELVENALDAGATDITINLTDAGTTLIEVRDNGCGMHADDVALALQRHATSKVRALDDLQHIASLGFRGEALPSIAAAAQQFSLATRTADAAQGTQLCCAGDTAPMISPIAMPTGTIVRIEQLFGALPARRKFLKSERTELAHCSDYCFRLALGAWHTRLVLLHQGKPVFRADRIDSAEQRVIELFGHDIAHALLPLEPASHADHPITLNGWCSPPGLAAGPRGDIYLYVNGRTVRDRVLLHAVREGYRTYVPDGFTPLVILSLTMPADLVDVNVHPAKAEVRFANSHAVHQFVAAALRKTLAQSNQLRHVTAAVTATTISPRTTMNTNAPTTAAPLRDVAHVTWQSAPARPSATAVAAAVQAFAPQQVHDSEPTAPTPVREQMPLMPHATATTALAPRYLGQLGTTYLLFDAWPRGMILIDQHAAHERIGYEQLTQQLRDQTSIQQLLTPQVIQCTALQHARLLDQRDLLQRCGLSIDDFGGSSIAITAAPSLLSGKNLTALCHAIADELLHSASATPADALRDHILMTIACHRQIRAGERLTADEAYALLEQLHIDTGLDRCPHGRPTWLLMPHTEITRRFGRS